MSQESDEISEAIEDLQKGLEQAGRDATTAAGLAARAVEDGIRFREQTKQLESLQGEVEEHQRLLADLWPPRINDSDDDNDKWSGYWLIADGGSPGTAIAQATLTYTLQKLLPDGSGGDGTNLATGVPLTGTGRRGYRGKVIAAKYGIARSNADGTYTLIWADEQPAGGRLFPVTVTGNGGTDGDNTIFAAWNYDVFDLDGVQILTAASVIKSRQRFGHVEQAPDGSTAVGIDYENGTFGLWDVSEVYGTGTCP